MPAKLHEAPHQRSTQNFLKSKSVSKLARLQWTGMQMLSLLHKTGASQGTNKCTRKERPEMTLTVWSLYGSNVGTKVCGPVVGTFNST